MRYLQILAVLMVALAVYSCVEARGEAIPMPKNGQCPTGYRSEAHYCVPSGVRTPQAIPKPKGAQCPTNWRSEADSCIAPEPRR